MARPEIVGTAMPKNARYIITEQAPMDANRVFRVRARDAAEHTAVEVWWSNGRGNCASCSSPLSAMSASCKHVAAVKRFLGIKPTLKVAPMCSPETAESLRKRAALMRKNAAEFIAKAEQYEAAAARLEDQNE